MRIQFLDPILLSSEVHRETHRRVQFLTAAKSMHRKFIGFFARLMGSSEHILCIAMFLAADNSPSPRRSCGR
jgi:hypothetical protein